MKRLDINEVKSNKYFTTNIATNAVTSQTNRLPNCTTFCMCAWHWCFDAVKSYSIMKGRNPGGFGNAKNWYKDYIYEKGSIPKIGSIAVWDGSYGHVAFVHDFEDAGNGYYNIKVYESNLSGRSNPSLYFRDTTYKVKVGAANTSGLGAFQGFCYHPFFMEKKEKPNIPIFTVGKIYRTKYVMNVRTGPGVNYPKKAKNQLTRNGQDNATANGCLKQNTAVTCGTVKTIGNDVWIHIPSGWIAAYYNGTMMVQ